MGSMKARHTASFHDTSTNGDAAFPSNGHRLDLSDQEKQHIKELIDRGEPLPSKYRLTLFSPAPEMELLWQGKNSDVTNVVLPFQSIEQIDEPRVHLNGQKLFAADAITRRQSHGWTNKLIWGDNKLVLSSLKNGPLRREIEAAGGLKLIYIDPPFDVGADFSVNIEVGEETLTKEPSIIEEIAYRDTWGRGANSYLAMMYERLRLMRDLMHSEGSIYVHCDQRVSGFMRSVLEEVFGPSYFVNEIIWRRTGTHGTSRAYGVIHDTIFFFAKTERYRFDPPTTDLPDEYLDSHYTQQDADGRRYQLVSAHGAGAGPERRFGDRVIAPPPGRHWAYSQERIDEMLAKGTIVFTSNGMPRVKRYADKSRIPVSALWTDLSVINSQASERVGYPTQKPESLLERVIQASSDEGDLVADFFCGSGTTAAVAEKLGRKWIGCDLGRFAIHTSRKRLIGVQRQLKSEDKPYRSFEILNLGKYERQYFAGIDPTLPEALRRDLTIRKEEHYLGLILSAYKAERLIQMPPFHGRKGSTLVLVGPIDAPVTLNQVYEMVDECRKKRISKVDVLGFEFEMGVIPFVRDEAKHKGISLSLKYIPKDVFDKRAVERGQVQFYDVAYVEVLPKIEKLSLSVTLKDFGVFYRQEHLATIAENLKPGRGKVTVQNGQVVKILKDKKGTVTREVLTKKWTDWIDYWAVDFNFESKREIIRVMEHGQEREVWTGNYVFENEWQSFRTRKDRALELTSGRHDYSARGKYKIAVKVIDIFGNDTTKVVEIKL